MSSVARGNAFERQVFDAVQRELRDDRLGISPALSKPFLKKGYYSRDRGTDIIVDISIEVWLPGGDKWSMLWVCECKDYSSPVPVNDVEEFKAKLDQIAGANKKGVMAVSGALQSSALNYARANGISVIRLLPDDQVRYLMYHMTPDMFEKLSRPDPNQFVRAFTQQNFIGKNQDFYATADGKIYGNWFSLLKAMLPSA